ncbi:hypothetical protein [Agromyces sp. NPDC057865]|uniref:hypothetical protein n=1 Tax=Agromyces sp. NPDC057865 TaxID=3346267 RepID=UPI00366CA8F7
MLLRLREISHIDVPDLFLLASGVGIATSIIACVTQLFIGTPNPLLTLGFLLYALLIALPICVIASILALSAGLGSRALTARLVPSVRTEAIMGGLGVVVTGVAVALVMAGPLGGFGPAFWTGIAASAIGGVALVVWALRCSRLE